MSIVVVICGHLIAIGGYTLTLLPGFHGLGFLEPNVLLSQTHFYNVGLRLYQIIQLTFQKLYLN